jgi:hypothetical protein
VRSCPAVDAETSRSLATFVSTGDSAIKPDWLAKSVRKRVTLTFEVSFSRLVVISPPPFSFIRAQPTTARLPLGKCGGKVR